MPSPRARPRSNGKAGGKPNGKRSPGAGSPLASTLGWVFFLICLAGALAAGISGGYWRRSHPHFDFRHVDFRSLVKKPLSGLRSMPLRLGIAASPTLLTAGAQSVPIIMYHDVTPVKQVWFDMTTREFRRQMEDLDVAGAHPISLQQLYDHLNSGKSLPSHPIALTFDDCTLGQLTDALPILLEHRFPATFFVQTAFVGKRTGKEHMTWEQLRQAERSGLIHVESHTVTHPEDITKLSDNQLNQEFNESRQTLEQRLGHPVSFLAYPSGHCDARVGKAAQAAGYLAAVTMDRGWAASPAESYFLPRFAPNRVADIIQAWTAAMPMEPPLPRLVPIKDAPLSAGSSLNGVTPIDYVVGGDLATQSLNTRKTVGELALAAGAQGALNGTFFADARVQSTGSAMVGPVLSRIGPVFRPTDAGDEPRIEGRPLVMVGDHRCLIVPYHPHLGGSLDEMRFVMPDVKDAFLAGAWIVHYGQKLPPDTMDRWSTRDYNDPRHRAFFGVDREGRYFLGATPDSVTTDRVGDALVSLGVQEAFLLDSGFSTSLIWQNRVLVSGHARKDIPSRPVPHALFLLGPVAPNAPPPPADSPIAAGPGAASTNEALAADSTAGAVRYHRHRRHHRLRV